MSFKVRRLTYGYRANAPVLRDVNLDIPSGATTAVLGASVLGKSTLLYLLGLLWDGRLDGEIIYQDGGNRADYARLKPEQAADLRRKDFGFVLQSSYMLPHFTCAQNAAMPLALRGRKAKGLLKELVSRVDQEDSLASVMHNAAGAVSGGQRQRFAVVRAVIHDPQVVFADEPFSSLDEDHTRLTLNLLGDWRQGKAPGQSRRAEPRTLVLVCHDLEMAWDRADFFVFVTRDGRVLGPLPGAVERARFRGPDDLREVIRTESLPTTRTPSAGPLDGRLKAGEVAR